MNEKELTKKIIETNIEIVKWTFRLRTARLVYGEYSPIECLKVLDQLEKERDHWEAQRDKLRGNT